MFHICWGVDCFLLPHIDGGYTLKALAAHRITTLEDQDSHPGGGVCVCVCVWEREIQHVNKIWPYEVELHPKHLIFDLFCSKYELRPIWKLFLSQDNSLEIEAKQKLYNVSQFKFNSMNYLCWQRVILSNNKMTTSKGLLLHLQYTCHQIPICNMNKNSSYFNNLVLFNPNYSTRKLCIRGI